MFTVFENWLVGQGLGAEFATLGAMAGGAVGVVLLAIIADVVAKRVVLRGMVDLAARTDTEWGDVLTQRRVFHRLAHIAPALVIYSMAPAVLGRSESATDFVQSACLLYMILVAVSVLDGPECGRGSCAGDAVWRAAATHLLRPGRQARAVLLGRHRCGLHRYW